MRKVRTEAERTIIKDIRKSYSKLVGRMNTLEKHRGEVVSPALNVFKQSRFYNVDTGQAVKISVKDLTAKELRILRSDIEYQLGLKTSLYKYAKEYTTQNSALMDSIAMLPDTVQKQFWEVYKKFSETYNNYEKVKYSVFEEIFENFDKYDVDSLAKMISDEYHSMNDIEDSVPFVADSHIDYTIY